LSWAYAFDPKVVHKALLVWSSWLSDYDEAMKRGAAAFVVARDMLLYQKLITDEAELFIAREELLRKKCAENVFTGGRKKSGKRGGGGGGVKGAAADKKEKKSGS
jgi:hypothetical protein